MSDAKAKIRKGTLYNRRMLSPEVWTDRVTRVQELILNFIKEKKVTCCHVFLPIARNKEFDSWDLVKKLNDHGIEVQLSVSDFATFKMNHFIYHRDLRFESNKFDIPEPVGGKAADISKVEMILIPLLASDKKGNRIGYGKGFYDRLLSDLLSKPLKVGVNLAPLFDHFPFSEDHDIKLDFCITPNQIYNCND
ncbi:MAG: 5-formyltetrahydrofolate cyclo-ligase [Cyclobacteriaceae bacterium]|jgi:5-formyltetrahydrofolate cyclo-ligase